jgi:hypothetical protein
VLKGRISPVEPRHPLVMGETDSRKAPFQLTGKGRLSRAEVAVYQVSGCHGRNNKSLPHLCKFFYFSGCPANT